VLRYREESGGEPTGLNVKRAAAELDANERDSADDPEADHQRDEEQSAKLIADWGSAAKKFKVGLSVESLNGPTRWRLAAILSEVQATISQLMATLNHRDQQGR
jgi:hypothetical protein